MISIECIGTSSCIFDHDHDAPVCQCNAGHWCDKFEVTKGVIGSQCNAVYWCDKFEVTKGVIGSRGN